MFLESINTKILASFGAIFLLRVWAEVCVAFNWGIYITASIITGTIIYDIWTSKNAK